MRAPMGVGLAASRACDSVAALSDVPLADVVDSAAGALGGVEGRRVAGAAPGGGGAAAPAPDVVSGSWPGTPGSAAGGRMGCLRGDRKRPGGTRGEPAAPAVPARR